MTARRPSALVKAAASNEVPVSPFEAFRLVVYTHGVEQLAGRLGMNRGTLYNKADADVESHAQPTLRDVIAVTRETGDTRVLDSLDRLFSRVAVDMTPHAPASDEALLDLLCRVGTEQGAMFSALHAALQDGNFSHEEVARVRAEAFDLVSAVLAFVQRLEGLRHD